MGGGRISASGLLLGAALAAAGASATFARAQSGSVVFDDFRVLRARYDAPDFPPLPSDEAEAFFRTSFGVRATIRLGQTSDGVDLATEPVYLSFGAFTAAIGSERSVTVDGDGSVVLRYSARDLNHLRRFIVRETRSGFRIRIRATRLSIPPPDRLTLQIGDDVGQVNLRTRQPTTLQSLIRGVVLVPSPPADASGTVVRTTCENGTCRSHVDDNGVFEITAAAGENVLALDAPTRSQDTLSQVVRRAPVRPGTNDVGIVVLPAPASRTERVVSAGQQPQAVVLAYPAGDGPQATVVIASGALLVHGEADGDPQSDLRVSLSPIAPDVLPVAMPLGVATPNVWAVEPAGARVTPCADVVIANANPEREDGERVSLYLLNRETGTWTAGATGIVENGGTVVRVPRALCELTSFFVACPPALTTVEATVTFRGERLMRVPVFVAGRTALTYPSGRNGMTLRLPAVSAGCADAPDVLTAYAALPLPDGYGYLSGVSASIPAVRSGRTNLGEIALSLCGDGIVDANEQCDGENVGTLTCADFGYAEGDVDCTATCSLDRSGCRTCGDGIVDPGEECDGDDAKLCPGTCRSTCTCPPVCGDGVRNQASEECDGLDDVLCPDACDAACACPAPPTTTTTLPPQSCPIAFELTPQSRARSFTGMTGMEVGFSGLGHDRDVPGGHPLTVAVDCRVPAPTCGECTIDGLAAVRGRCTNDPARECDALHAPDPDDCGGARCDVFFLPPLHNMWGGGPSCFVERLTADVGGAIFSNTGEARLSVQLAGDLYFGVSPTQPCPICAGDPHANDGSLDGKCVGGEFEGLACDANGDDPTFGPTSFDCLPGPGMRGAPLPLERRLDLHTNDVEIPFAVPCDFPADELACACAVCAGDASIACASDQDCTDAGTTGPCAGRGGGALRKPNECEDFACIDTGDGVHGRCAAGPNETYCDGVLFAHGTPILPCRGDADCNDARDACGGDCGQCTIVKPRSCFLDPILSDGHALPNLAVLSDVTCLAPGVSPALDVVGGVPGPERVTIEMRLRRIFDGEAGLEDLSRTPRRRRP